MPTIPFDQETSLVILPQPSLPEIVTLELALKNRHSTRAFLSAPLPLDILSTLLWAGFGVNRPKSLGRTAPSAHNWQETDVYAVLAEGAYRYDAQEHRLQLVSTKDLRSHTGMQDFVAVAPLELVYVADFSRMQNVNEEDRPFLAGADVGFIAQNVCLYCAGTGLATVVRAMVDRRKLSTLLGLTNTQRITLAQTVGYPGHQAISLASP